MDPGELSGLGGVDLAWLALSLHHLRDRAATLARVVAQLRPGGGLCLLERHTPLQVQTADELDRPGLWERVWAAQRSWYSHARATHHSHDDLQQLATAVAATGLDVALTATLERTGDLPASPTCALLVARHAQLALRSFPEALEPADVDALASPGALARLSRSAATFTATRLLVVAGPVRQRDIARTNRRRATSRRTRAIAPRTPCVNTHQPPVM